MSAGKISCRQAQKIMSPFIDSATDPQEADQLQSHLYSCEPCQRQLQSYVSVRNLVRSVESPHTPPDLGLEIRVRHSQQRNPRKLAGYRVRVANALRPVAIPALLAACSTVLSFAFLLGDLIAPPVSAATTVSATSTALYKHVRTTDPTLSRFAAGSTVLTEPLTVDILVSGSGRMIDYTVLSGPNDPDVDVWLRELLYYAEFTPANLFGRPVQSRIIISFIGVTS